MSQGGDLSLSTELTSAADGPSAKAEVSQWGFPGGESSGGPQSCRFRTLRVPVSGLGMLLLYFCVMSPANPTSRPVHLLYTECHLSGKVVENRTSQRPRGHHTALAALRGLCCCVNSFSPMSTSCRRHTSLDDRWIKSKGLLGSGFWRVESTTSPLLSIRGVEGGAELPPSWPGLGRGGVGVPQFPSVTPVTSRHRLGPILPL